MNITVVTDPVLCARACRVEPDGPHRTHPLIYLFDLKYELHFSYPQTGIELEVLSLQPDTELTLFRLRLHNVEAKVSATGFINPQKKEPSRKFAYPNLTGEVVLRLVDSQNNRYRIVLGDLRFGALPILRSIGGETILPPNWPHEFVFWPSQPEDYSHHSLVFTSVGLAMEGPINSQRSEAKDLLLLPKLASDTRYSNIAWSENFPEKSKLYQRIANEKGYEDPKKRQQPNRQALLHALALDAPDPQQWPPKDVHQPCIALRWRLITPSDSPLVQSIFVDQYQRVKLQLESPVLGDGRSVNGTDTDWANEVVSLHRLESESLMPGERMLAMSGGSVAATLSWNAERSSLLTTRLLRVGWDAQGELASMVLRSHVPSAPDPEIGLKLSWPATRTEVPPDAVNMQWSSTEMFYAGNAVAWNTSNERPEPPRWLALQEGLLELAASDWSDGHRHWSDRHRHRAKELIARLDDVTQVFRGGLPLESLEGPQGLSAWVVADPNQPDDPDGEVVLRLDRQQVCLTVSRPLLLWRTPAWWIPDERKPDEASPQPNVPDISTPFDKVLMDGATDISERSASYQAALQRSFIPGLWAGQVNAKSLPDEESGWRLEHSTVTRWHPPSHDGMIAAVWLQADPGYFVRTLPLPGEPLHSALLNPYRGLVGWRPGLDPGIHFELENSKLPSWRQPPERPQDAGYQALTGDTFHPVIPALTWLPEASHYVARHGPGVLVDGYLRGNERGEIVENLVTDSLASVRAQDDVAIEKLEEGQKTEVFGWLPAPHSVKAREWSFKLRGDNPVVKAKIAGGVDGKTPLFLQWGRQYNGIFADAECTKPVSVASDPKGRIFWLEANDSAPLLNFGQSLLRLMESQALVDGSSLSAWPFYLGQRAFLDRKDGSRFSLLTERRTGFLHLRYLDTVPALGLCLLNLPTLINMGEVEASPPPFSAWDLVGPEPGAVPHLGPVPLVPIDLEAVNVGEAIVTVATLPPCSLVQAKNVSSGQVRLRWKLQDGNWTVDLPEAGGFTWQIDRPAEADAASLWLKGLEGSICPSTEGLVFMVTTVVLATSLGDIRVACEVPIIWSAEGSTICRIQVGTHDATWGLNAVFTLVLNESGKWEILTPQEDVAATQLVALVTWSDSQGKIHLRRTDTGFRHEFLLSEVKLPALTKSLDDLPLKCSQASSTSWMFKWSWQNGAHHNALVGLLHREDAPSRSTRLNWRMRATYKLTAEDCRQLLGPCGSESWMRADATICSQHFGGSQSPEEPQAALTGALHFWNRYQYQFSDGQCWRHEATCVFDRVAFKKSGFVINACAEHRLISVEQKDARVKFQIPQQLEVVTGSGVQGSAVVVLRLDASAQPPVFDPQILFDKDYSIDLSPIKQNAEQWGPCAVIRVPFYSGEEPPKVGLDSLVETLFVPDAASSSSEADLSWFPNAPAPSVPKPNNTELKSYTTPLWHERRSYAPWLAADNLGAWCARNVSARFQSGALPKSGDTLPEWSLLQGHKGWLYSGLLATDGVLATSIYASVGSNWDYASVNSNLNASADALPVVLLSPVGLAEQSILKIVGEALLNAIGKNIPDTTTAIREWAARELRRRSMRTCSAVVVRGRPDYTCLVGRGFAAAALMDQLPPPLLTPKSQFPSHSSMVTIPDGDESLPEHRLVERRLWVRTDEQAVTEIVTGRPLVAGSESATRYRTMLSSFLPAGEPTALTVQQSMRFASDPDGMGIASLPHLRLSKGTSELPAITPPITEATLWSVRPGDSVSTTFSMTETFAVRGPLAQATLRGPLGGGGSVDQDFSVKIDNGIKVEYEGVSWTISGIEQRREVAKVVTDVPGGKLRVCLIAPVESFQVGIEELDANAELPLSFARPLNKQRVVSEPWLFGVLGPGEAEFLPGLSLGLMSADEPDSNPPVWRDCTPIAVDEVLDSSTATDHWNSGEFKVLRLSPWQLSGQNPLDPDIYRDDAAQGLNRILCVITDEKHWLIKNAGARWVLLRRKLDGTCQRRTLAKLKWREASSAGQPVRLLWVANERVAGYGDSAGPQRMVLNSTQKIFEIHQCTLGLAPADTDKRVWLFAPSGACVAYTEKSTT